MNSGELLSLVIEASITIAGFSGIVVVLGPRQAGHWTSVDRLRLRGLLNASFLPVAVSGLALVLLSSGFATESVWRISSAIHAGVAVIFISSGIRRAAKLPPEELNRTQMFVIGIIGVMQIGLLVFNAASIGAFWPLFVVLCVHIGVALFNFSELLWRAISRDST